MNPLSNQAIAFCGGGNMAEALIGGLLRAGLAQPESIRVFDPSAERRVLLAQKFEVTTSHSNAEAVNGATVVILAIKPQTLGDLAGQLAGASNANQLYISILAGVGTARLEAALAHGGNPRPRVVRSMPNTPALIGEGATAICAGAHSTPEDLATARAVFDAAGISAIVPETQMDAITGLTGSGPAYVFRFIEGLLAAAAQQGLDPGDAERLVKKMVYGAARLALESNEAPAELRRRVTSPGGTTAAGLKVMDDNGFVDLIGEAVDAATTRSKELGNPKG